MGRIYRSQDEELQTSPLEKARLFSGEYWDEMRVFLAVAKCSSFGKAAELLNKSTPTVSRKVRRLQDVVGAQLVVSTPSGASLTEKGLQLAETLAHLDLLLSTLSDDLKTEKSEAAGTVRVSVTEGLAGFFVAPNLHQVSDVFPHIQVVLQAYGGTEPLRSNGTDIVIGIIPDDIHGVNRLKLGTVHLIPIMSRTYFEKHGAVTNETLARHRFVHCSQYGGKTNMWNSWLELMEAGTVAHVADQSFTYGMMVKAGLGIGLLANYTLLEPNAIPICCGVHIPVPLHIAVLADRMESRPVRIVFDFLSELFSSKNPWFADALRIDPAPTDYDRGFRELFNIPAKTASPTRHLSDHEKILIKQSSA